MNETLIHLTWLLHFGATMFMTGVIWFVQIVHYPSFTAVDRQSFPLFERRHVNATARVVGPPMLLESATALALLVVPPGGVRPWAMWGGIALLAVIWLSTAFLQVPCHERLSSGFDQQVHRRLVRTNWIRTAAWSVRAVLVLALAAGTDVHAGRVSSVTTLFGPE